MSTRGAKQTELPYASTFEVRDACLCLHVQRAARALARRFDEAFRPLDLTNGQFSMLMSLNRAQPPSLGSVASLLAMDRTTLTAALKPLVRRRLVMISVDKKDRRSRLLTIRPAGRALLAKAFPVWQQTHIELERHISQPKALRAALLAVVPISTTRSPKLSKIS
jgi:DNA-binding MarR family transcriptional regulator